MFLASCPYIDYRPAAWLRGTHSDSSFEARILSDLAAARAAGRGEEGTELNRGQTMHPGKGEVSSGYPGHHAVPHVRGPG